MGNYVEIVVGGKKEDIEKFINDLKSKKPPLSKIDDLKIFKLKDGILTEAYWKYERMLSEAGHHIPFDETFLKFH